MILYSESYAGEWPTGVYWSPGETRELPDSVAVEDMPAGLSAAPPVASEEPAYGEP